MMAIDLELALRAMDGDRELLEQLAVIFSEDTPRIALEFKEAIKRQDFASARMAIHSLKGLTASFYEPQSVEMFAQYESFCADKNWDAIQGAAAAVTERIAKLIDEMRALGLLQKTSSAT
jgi:HPt (histidine-containing phosphotransfer) domain-containing protein